MLYNKACLSSIGVKYSLSLSLSLSLSWMIVRPTSTWFFHIGEVIVIAWTQEKTTLGGTEPHHSSWQCKKSRSCCHKPFCAADNERVWIIHCTIPIWVNVIMISSPKLKNHCSWQWEILEHPPYSPDMSPRDYDLFAKVKEPLQGTRYNTGDELIRAIGTSMRIINKDGRTDGVQRLPNIWQKVINMRGRLYWRYINVVPLWIKPCQK